MEPSCGLILGITALVMLIVIAIAIWLSQKGTKVPKVSFDNVPLREFSWPPKQGPNLEDESSEPKIVVSGREVVVSEHHANEQVSCPKCGGTQITANNKGFGLGKAVGGGLLLGPVGLLGGFIGSKKVLITCLKCGKQWKP